MSRFVPALAAASLAAAARACAFSVFGGFEGETSGGSILTYAGLASWTVVGRQVDLLRSGEFGRSCRTGDSCVDLEGGSLSPGVLPLKTPIAVNPGDLVDILVWLSGNQRGRLPDTVTLSFMLVGPIPITGFERLVNGINVPWGGSTPRFPGPYVEWEFSPSDAFRSLGFRFAAGGATLMTLRLKNSGFANIGAILDDVSVTVRPLESSPSL